MNGSDVLSDLTTQQKELVETIKKDLGLKLECFPDFNTTFHIVRFLKARKWDIEKTKKMLDDYFNWRTENDYYEICKFNFSPYHQTLRDNFLSGQYFTDKEGRPVLIEQLGIANPKELFKTFNENHMKYYYIQFFERLLHIQMPICSKMMGKRVDKVVQIFDMREVNVKKLFDNSFIKFIKFVSKIGQDFYPEILHSTYVVNTPILFWGFYNALKYLLDPVTRDRIRLFSGPATKELLEIIDADKLPISLGGTCEADVRDCPGPWKDEIDVAKREGRFILRDRTPEYNYFYSKEERPKIDKKQASSEISMIKSVTMVKNEIMEVRTFTPSLKYLSKSLSGHQNL